MPNPEKQKQERENSKKQNVLERLFAKDEKMVYQIWSDNKEFGDIRGDEFVPAPLAKLLEKEIMWDLVRSPLSDEAQIKSRQSLFETFIDSGQLEQITNLKNTAYQINSGIRQLFSDVRLNYEDLEDDRTLPALVAYRRGYKHCEHYVMSALKRIETGKVALTKLAEKFRETDQPIIHEMGEFCRADLKKINHFNNDYFLKQQYNLIGSEILSEDINNDITHIGALIEFSNIFVKEKYAKAEYNSEQLAEYIQGWNFVKEKFGEKPQILNDSVDDNSVSILCGANMGGKSFHLEQNHYIQLCAQSLGFVPAEKGNFQIYDSILFLDRASTDATHDLSAFGAEVKNIVEAFGDTKDKKIFVSIDEGLSTTSAEDQYYILAGITEYLKNHKGKTFLATHSEEFIKHYENDTKTGIYNFPFDLVKNEDGTTDIKYTNILTEGKGDSRALEVAEVLGLQKRIIDLAKQYIALDFEKITPPKERFFREPEAYSDEERQKLKMKIGFPPALFEVAGEYGFEWRDEKKQVFRLFTKDKDFEDGIYTGEGDDSKSMMLLRLITKGEKIAPQNLLERQKMFEVLSQNDRYRELEKIGGKVRKIIYNLPKFSEMTGKDGFLDFNRLLKPEIKWYEEYGNNDYISYFESCIMFLNLNKKILGKDFPNEYVDLPENLKIGIELLIARSKYFDNLDILEMPKGKIGAYSTEEVREKFFELTSGLESKEAKEKWQDKICLARINEFIKLHDNDKNEKIISTLKGFVVWTTAVQTDFDIKNENIREMYKKISSAKSDVDSIVTNELINKLIDKLCKPFEDMENKLMAKSIFECDLQSIDSEIQYFTKHYRGKYRSEGHIFEDERPRVLVFCDLLEMFLDKRDYFKEYIAILREYDSIHLHKLADDLEKKLYNFLPFIGEDSEYYQYLSRQETEIEKIGKDVKYAKEYFKKNGKRFRSLCSKEEFRLIDEELCSGSNKKMLDLIENFTVTGPQRIWNILKTVFEKNSKEMLSDFVELENYYKKIPLYERIFEQNKYSSGRGQKFLQDILNGYNTTDNELMDKAYDGMGWLKETRYLPKIDGEREIKIAKYKSLYKKLIIDSGMYVTIKETLAGYENAYPKAKEFIDKYDLDLKGKMSLKMIEDGNLKYLKDEVYKKYRDAVDGVFEEKHYYDYDDKATINEVKEVEALSLFGHMINVYGFCKVKYNTDGTVDMKDMFNMFENKAKQKLNDAHFDQNEYARLIAAANMSGKTYYLKALTMAILSGLTTGYAPAAEATMPLFDNVLYLDRVTSNLDGNLSALGNEVKLWNQFFEVIGTDQSVFVAAAVDEAFSTTSPKYQASLVYAIVMEMIQQGQCLAIASHNHDVINYLRNLEKELLKAYTMKIQIDEKGLVAFDHKLRELQPGERSFSDAIPVARTLGMPEEILLIAEELKERAIQAHNGRVNLA